MKEYIKTSHCPYNTLCHPRVFLSGISTLVKTWLRLPITTLGNDSTVRAFTLIELLVVVLIIGILSAIALPQYNKAVEKSRAAEAMQILRYMHNQSQLCALANGENGCYSKTNAELGIELGGDFTCDYDGESEICCNDHWCYENNGVIYGTVCVGGFDSPVARRVREKPSDARDTNPLYDLQLETCEEAPHPNHIICYSSDKYCKIFRGKGNPVD